MLFSTCILSFDYSKTRALAREGEKDGRAGKRSRAEQEKKFENKKMKFQTDVVGGISCEYGRGFKFKFGTAERIFGFQRRFTGVLGEWKQFFFHGMAAGEVNKWYQWGETLGEPRGGENHASLGFLDDQVFPPNSGFEF